ncbi:MAG TPA: Spy/CpxP family protein refolding chaperone [Pyrinomonadaceae bacterium]|jgi:Spy/CpxP family protein refolding chaperone|nr:Spy/CpxP family protein refolding chaperone [Pyrinomonadaceae bacterium]
MRLNWKKTSGVVAIVGALLLVMAMVAFSQGPQGPPRGGGFHGGPGGPHDGLGPLARDLNLTDEQQAQVKKLTDGFAESTKALHDQLRTLHESQPDPLSGAAFDEAAVRSAAEAHAKIEVELEVAHARLMSQIFSLLTPEQKAKIAARRQEFEQRHKDGPRPPREDGPDN